MRHTIIRRAPEGPNSLAEYEAVSRRQVGNLNLNTAIRDTSWMGPIDFKDGDKPITFGPEPVSSPTVTQPRDWSGVKKGVEQGAEAIVGILQMTHQHRMAQDEADRRRREADLAERRSTLDIQASQEEREFMQRYGASTPALAVPLLLGGAALLIFLMTRKN